MGGLEVALVGFFVGVDFEDVDLTRVFLGLHREEGQHAEKRVQKYGKKRKVCSFPDEKSVSKLQLDTSCREALERLMNQPCTTRW